MAVAESEGGRRERVRGLGWRALEAFANRREASILVVAIGLIIYFSLRSSAFYSSATIKNIAEYVAPITVKRDWALARAWLFREIEGASS